jgi:hypothetical protein
MYVGLRWQNKKGNSLQQWEIIGQIDRGALKMPAER